MTISRTVLAAAMAAGLSTTALAASPTDWSAIPTNNVTLFYPGQSTFQWLRTDAHPGSKLVAKGKPCTTCHKGKEAKMGEDLVVANKLEPTPVEGKNGSIDLAFQVAYDNENAYFRFQWKTRNDYPGYAHPYLRFDGKEWHQYGYPKLDAVVQSGEQPGIYEDRMSIMIDDGSVPGFAEQGCWLTCHQGMRDMPDEASKEAVQGHALLGKGGLDETDVRKYLPASRSDEEASWSATKSADEIAKIKADGGFVDLMQWRAARSNPVGMADDGYVLEYRLFDEGKNPFSWNVDRKTMTPKYMFDAGKVGVKAITVDDIGDPSKPFAMIREENAAPYDPNAGWKEGDVLPGRLLSRADASGSAADNDNAKGVWENSAWTVVWTRKMNTGHPGDDKILEDGKAYTFGFAVHDDNVTTRFHFVGWPVSIGFGAAGDIQATKVP